jgi:anti-sigma regulatory factor (Ser/Thr protein kinase)
MPDNVLTLHYDIEGNDFTSAGEASGDVKRKLRMLGISPNTIRKLAVAMYEGEINQVIHANGGHIDVEITPQLIKIVLSDEGPGIPDVEAAMSEGFSTATEEIHNMGFGAGMGLPNMKKYSDTFELETEVGKGTVITMTVNIE